MLTDEDRVLLCDADAEPVALVEPTIGDTVDKPVKELDSLIVVSIVIDADAEGTFVIRALTLATAECESDESIVTVVTDDLVATDALCDTLGVSDILEVRELKDVRIGENEICALIDESNENVESGEDDELEVPLIVLNPDTVKVALDILEPVRIDD